MIYILLEIYGTDDGESTTILQASGEDCCDSVEVQLFQPLTDVQCGT